jgi:hypothetical protein
MEMTFLNFLFFRLRDVVKIGKTFERRRGVRERNAGGQGYPAAGGFDPGSEGYVAEFVESLPPKLRDCCARELAPDREGGDQGPYSPAEKQHRLRVKQAARAFVAAEGRGPLPRRAWPDSGHPWNP